MLHHNIPQRDRARHPGRCPKKERHRQQMKVWKSTLGLQHNSCQCLFLYALLILGITVDVVMAGGVGSSSGGGPRPCLSGHAYKRTALASSRGLAALQQVSTPNLLLPPPTPHPWNTTCLLRYFETPVKQREVGPGLLFTSNPVPSTTTVGVCQGPGKHNQAGRRNFPLTQEIGTSCATTQSNRLSYFTDCPVWHMLATQGYFVFRSTIIHLRDGLEPVLSTSSAGLTKADCCYV